MNSDNQEGGLFGLTKPYEMSTPRVPDEDELLSALLLLPDEAFVWNPRKQVYVCRVDRIKIELRPSSLKGLKELKESILKNG